VSQEPVIRVQAAAVAVKVRAEAKSDLERALLDADAPSLPNVRVRALAGRISALVTSGLLEDRDRERGQSRLDLLVTQLIADLDADDGDPSRPRSAAVRELVETELLRQGRYGEFRAVRARAARVRAPDRPPGGVHG
jgi:hypothetical protein